MKLDRDYLPIVDVCPKPKDESRETLLHLSVQRIDGTRGHLVAADGFVLAVVPVTLDPDDVPGLVDPDALKQASRGQAKQAPIDVTLTDTAVVAPNGASYPRLIPGGLSIDSAYPDYHRIVPRHVNRATGETPGLPIAFNHVLLGKVAKALGGLGITLWPNPKGAASPIVVTPIVGGGREAGFDADGLPIAPYAVVMPMHVARPAAQHDRAA